MSESSSTRLPSMPTRLEFVGEDGAVVHRGGPNPMLFRGATVAFHDDDNVYVVDAFAAIGDLGIVHVKIVPDDDLHDHRCSAEPVVEPPEHR